MDYYYEMDKSNVYLLLTLNNNNLINFSLII